MTLDPARAGAWSRDEAAEVYERGRPGYAEAAVDWVLAPVREGARVLDLGAGTGKLTRQLTARRLDTLAVEPSAAMRRVLAAAVPAATVLPGSAEEVPLPDASVDAVVVGQAFHWFDRDPAVRELARVLRPGGVLGLLWNLRDERAAWVPALSEIIGETEDHAGGPEPRIPDLGPALHSGERERFAHEQELDPARLLDLVGSRSYVIRLPPAERAAVLDRVAALARTHPDLAGRPRFALPYVTVAYRFRS
jgi:SAM-dependent methyltransferase